MNLRLDFRSAYPLYSQIAGQLQELITSGQLLPGDQLPPVRLLAEQLQVNFNTVARAYRSLDQAGLVSTQHGRGTFVWLGHTPENNPGLRQQQLHQLAQQFVRSAGAMGYGQEEILNEIKQALANTEVQIRKIPEDEPLIENTP
jgi:GntR family transcriptional regulator